jgi:carboxyl-terminal processing protease
VKKLNRTSIHVLVIVCLVVFSPVMLHAQGGQKGALRPGQEEAVKKFDRTIELINRFYVDTIDNGYLVEQAIIGMLKQMDPHSNYFTAEQIQRANESLEGSFEGIGVEYQIIDDTAVVMWVHTGGPAFKAGLVTGDRVLKIDEEPATGKSVNNSWISKRVRGEKGSTVQITILRDTFTQPKDISIIRDKITTYGVDGSFMLNGNTGYIKVGRFMRTTVPEFEQGMNDLKKQGMNHLILDLRGNTGGYLNSAVQLADHFLGKKKIIVYTEGVNSARVDYTSTGKGDFRKGRLIVLIDEQSASASEIVTGAVQDWDRGVVMGRRSYGKGLVQKPFSFTDGSAVRLTIAKYYTPVGRSIQRPYDQGREKYFDELNEKIRSGVFASVDSMNLHDSLKFYTPAGKVVYGGGGIMPDILVPADSSGRSDFTNTLNRRNMYNRYVLQALHANRDSLLRLYPHTRAMDSDDHWEREVLPAFLSYVEYQGISIPEVLYDGQKMLITRNLMTTTARLLHGNSEALKVSVKRDILIIKAMEVVRSPESYQTMLTEEE